MTSSPVSTRYELNDYRARATHFQAARFSHPCLLGSPQDHLASAFAHVAVPLQSSLANWRAGSTYASNAGLKCVRHARTGSQAFSESYRNYKLI